MLDHLPAFLQMIDRLDERVGGEVTDAVVESYGPPGVFMFGDIGYHGVEFTLGVTSYE